MSKAMPRSKSESKSESSSMPLVERDEEVHELRKALQGWLSSSSAAAAAAAAHGSEDDCPFDEAVHQRSQGGSIYMCGSTGTGKTFCVNYVVDILANCEGKSWHHFNCCLGFDTWNKSSPLRPISRKPREKTTRDEAKNSVDAGLVPKIQVAKLNGNTFVSPHDVYGELLRAFSSSSKSSTMYSSSSSSPSSFLLSKQKEQLEAIFVNPPQSKGNGKSKSNGKSTTSKCRTDREDVPEGKASSVDSRYGSTGRKRKRTSASASPSVSVPGSSSEASRSPGSSGNRNYSRQVKNKPQGKRKSYIVIIDEIDQLVRKGKGNGSGKEDQSQNVLYSLFQWAHSPSSNLILIGIANTVNLDAKFLPRLSHAGGGGGGGGGSIRENTPGGFTSDQSNAKKKKARFLGKENDESHRSSPASSSSNTKAQEAKAGTSESQLQFQTGVGRVIIFEAYTSKQLREVLRSHIAWEQGWSLKEFDSFITGNALELCARKIASKSGDARKALEVLRKAIRDKSPTAAQPLDMASISRAISPHLEKFDALTPQCKSALSVLANLVKEYQKATIKFDDFAKSMKKRKLAPLSAAEFRSEVLSGLEMNGFVSVRRTTGKAPKPVEITLEVLEDDIRTALT